MLKLITSGEFSDFTVDGLIDVPEDFDIKAEFRAFLASNGVPAGYDQGRYDALEALFCKLTGKEVFDSVNECELVMPWLKSIGITEVQFEAVDPTDL